MFVSLCECLSQFLLDVLLRKNNEYRAGFESATFGITLYRSGNWTISPMSKSVCWWCYSQLTLASESVLCNSCWLKLRVRVYPTDHEI